MEKLKEKAIHSYLYSGNAPFVEALYEEYLADEAAVPDRWKSYFDALQKTSDQRPPDARHASIQKKLIEMAQSPRGRSVPVREALRQQSFEKQAGVLGLIHSYRLFGHLRAALDPIALREAPSVPSLDPCFYGLTDDDMDTPFNTGDVHAPAEAPLKEILQLLKDVYAGPIGVEYMHITDLERKRWIEERLEPSRSRTCFSAEEKRDLLSKLTAAEGLERYLHTKYTGQKRFSLEGGEGLIPLMDGLIRHAGSLGVEEIAMGMAHRGRLNVLVNIMGKRPKDLFLDFEGKNVEFLDDTNTGDVKYHQGFSADIELPSGPMHLALAFNPSHLEIIDPVVEGSVRARQDRLNDHGRSKVIALLIHGDAAMAGQGVVYETLNLAQTRGFTTGGTVHIVVNNRIGFTTSHPLDARSTFYCTDIGKVVQAPVFHVNGDDPEAIAFVAQLAMDYRMTFQSDVMIDLVCYRRHGHNEADEPSATQPMMYDKIRGHKGSRAVYADKLIREGTLTPAEVDRQVEDYHEALDARHQVFFFKDSVKHYPYTEDWAPYLVGKWTDPADTTVSISELKRIGELAPPPADCELHPRVVKIMEDRRKMAAGALPLDWGCAETLAYGTLLTQGYAVRLTGQDSGRGTFFHRHAVLYNQRTGESYVPLRHLSEDQPRFTLVDSILSEEAVLGFEYGYSTATPHTLVIWEAQYGDFVNVAQVVIDQYISSSEQKWNRLCGVVLMLPHGWEGQGPEHSSARLERFMQLCAHDNIQVCAPTSPAQMFHLLRRQMVRPYRKPLVIMSPKSMLRRKGSFSSLEELSVGGFHTVLGEVDALKPAHVKRIVLCSGKIYYDLLELRRKQKMKDVVIIRVEQLYPFPVDALIREITCYPQADEIVWAQEEPMNQGAWYAIQHHLRACMRPRHSLSYAGRLSSAAPAGGSYQKHLERQQRLVAAALNLGKTGPRPMCVFEPKRTPEPV